MTSAGNGLKTEGGASEKAQRYEFALYTGKMLHLALLDTGRQYLSMDATRRRSRGEQLN